MAKASATATVGEATSYAEDGRKPPEWELDRMEVICDDEIAGDGESYSSCPSCSCGRNLDRYDLTGLPIPPGVNPGIISHELQGKPHY